jgi:hypothetical protein
VFGFTFRARDEIESKSSKAKGERERLLCQVVSRGAPWSITL